MKPIVVKDRESLKSWKSVIMGLLFLIPVIFTYLMNTEDGDWFALTKWSFILVLVILTLVILILIYNKLWFHNGDEPPTEPDEEE